MVLPGLSPSHPGRSPLGCGHTRPTGLGPTSAWACLRQTYPKKTHLDSQGKDSGLPRWDTRGGLARPGAPVLPFCSFGQRTIVLSGAGTEPASSAFPRTLPLRSAEASASGQGQTEEHLGSEQSGWGLLSAVRPGDQVSMFCWVLLPGSDIISWFHCRGPLHKAPQVNLWVSVCSVTPLGHVQAQ